MSVNREHVAFAIILAQEYPTLSGVADVVADLIRLSRQHQRLQERACNEQVPDNHDARCESRIRSVCTNLPGCSPIFSSDPGGATVKLSLPSGRTDDWGAIGICVPN